MARAFHSTNIWNRKRKLKPKSLMDGTGKSLRGCGGRTRKSTRVQSSSHRISSTSSNPGMLHFREDTPEFAATTASEYTPECVPATTTLLSRHSSPRIWRTLRRRSAPSKITKSFNRRKIKMILDSNNQFIPKAVETKSVFGNIKRVLRKSFDYELDSIHAYGCEAAFRQKDRKKLKEFKINFMEVPSPAIVKNDGRDYSDIKIMKMIYLHTLQFDPPAPLLLGTGDQDYYDTIVDLRENGYEVLLAHDEQTTSKLINSTTDSMVFKELASGNLKSTNVDA